MTQPDNLKPLEGPDAHHLRAAEGWIELGAFESAWAELDALSIDALIHPEVQELRCHIWQAAGAHKEVLLVSQMLTAQVPHRVQPWLFQAEAMSELGDTLQAYSLLLGVADRFLESAEMFYLLGRLGWKLQVRPDVDKWLTHAFQLGGRLMKDRALMDPEFVDYWIQLKSMGA